MHGITLRSINRVSGLLETLCLPHILSLEKVAETNEEVCGFGSLCVIHVQWEEKEQRTSLWKQCSGQGNVGLPICRAAACILPKSVLGGGNRHVTLHPNHDSGYIT